MKSLKLVLFVLVLSNTCLTSLAQTGRDLLITNNGDTLRGAIKPIETYSKSVSFRGSEQSEYKTYSASDISFAIRGAETFRSVTIRSVSEERIFLQVLALGEINLYKGKNRYYLEKDSMVQTLTKKDTIINNFQKTDRSYVGHLTLMMLDGNIPIDKISATAFDDHDLTRLVTLYNREKGSQLSSRSFEKKEEPSFAVGIKGGLYSSTIKYTKGKYAGYTFNPHSGSIFDIYGSFRVTNKFYIQPEFYFVSKGGVYRHQLQGNYGQREMKFDYLIRSSQLSLNLRYNLRTGRFTPYMLGGFCFALSSKSRTYRQVVYEDYTVLVPEVALVSEIGYRGAVGVNYKLVKAWQISVEALFEHTRLHSPTDSDFYCNGFGILAGINYSFGSSSK